MCHYWQTGELGETVCMLCLEYCTIYRFVSYFVCIFCAICVQIFDDMCLIVHIEVASICVSLLTDRGHYVNIVQIVFFFVTRCDMYVWLYTFSSVSHFWHTVLTLTLILCQFWKKGDKRLAEFPQNDLVYCRVPTFVTMHCDGSRESHTNSEIC